MTARSQTTSKDSICFSRSQAVTIMQDLKRVNVFDSIIQNQNLQIHNFKKVVTNGESQLKATNTMLDHTKGELNATRTKLKISKRLTFYGVPIAFGGGALFILLLK